MLTPIQLRAIREVVATGSLRTAAKRLGFTPSAVSQQISSLERTLGVQLFERSPRSVRPTAAGLSSPARRPGCWPSWRRPRTRCARSPPRIGAGCIWEASGQPASGWC
ncbi:LysR family transcriptional regulator [Streptosporangium lutulentum]